MSLSLQVDWYPGWETSPETRETGALLRISVNGQIATRNDNDWSRSVHDQIFVSAYPLACWIAGSWWRLLYEPAPGAVNPPTDWRMSHDLPAAGGGFVWPLVRFEPEGDTLEVTAKPTVGHPAEPLRYLVAFRERVTRADAERGLAAFVELTLGRLASGGVSDSELAALWGQLEFEKRDPAFAAYRCLEARLGFDPDDAPGDVMTLAEQLGEAAGSAALAEIAPACASDPAPLLRAVLSLAASPGVPAQPQDCPSGFTESDDDGRGSAAEPVEPWRRGYLLARRARQFWGLGHERLSDARLGELLEIPAGSFDQRPPSPLPLGLAVRAGQEGGLRLHFRGGRPFARRFEGARFLAEALTARASEPWLALTATHSARQKTQRAFAAEFLAPAAALGDFLAGDASEERLEEAAAHFRVSSLAIRNQVVNHDLAPL